MKFTVDHDEIQAWIEAHNGVPCTIKEADEEELESPDMLHICFSENGLAPDMTELSWDEFFQRFDDENLALVYDEKAQPGDEAPDFELADRDYAHERLESENGNTLAGMDSGDEGVLEQNLIPDSDME